MSRIETIQLEWFSVDEKLPELKHTRYYDGDKYSDEVWFRNTLGLIFKGNYKSINLFWSNGWFRHKDIIEWCYPPVDIH